MRHGAFTPVVGLAAPDLPGWLVASESGSVTLGYGTASDPDGPYVSVRTSLAPADLAGLLADERDRAFRHASVVEFPPETVRSEPGLLSVDGHGLPTRVRHDDALWGAAATVPHTLIPGKRALAVVARGVPPSRLRFTLVYDLAPLWVARDEWLAALRERR